MKRSYSVQIAGQKYSLRSDADERQVHELAALVDRKMAEIQRRTKLADSQSLAVLTALQLAEELADARRETQLLKHEVREKGRAILEYLERATAV